MPRAYRPKASELFARGPALFAAKGSLSEAYPEIAELEVTVTRGPPYASARREELVFTAGHPCGEWVNCINPLCYGGGVSIGRLLREMVREQRTAAEATEICSGSEGSPGGRRRKRDCIHFFEVRVRIAFRGDAGPIT